MSKTAAKPAEQVRVVKGMDPRSMLTHPVYVKAFVGQRELTFLVDTGCDRSILPKKLVGGARIKPADCHLYAANGTSITVLGEVVLGIRLGTEIIFTRLIVSKNIAEPLLGSDWLRCNQITWDFKRDLLM